MVRYISLAVILNAIPLMAQPFVIQENEIGFCNVDGAVLTDVSGYTGSGYADTDRGEGKSINWSVRAGTSGPCTLRWRYANGGGSGDRPARILINGITAIDSFNFPHTGSWTNWVESDSAYVNLETGYNMIRL
jgi:pectate lyase